MKAKTGKITVVWAIVAEALLASAWGQPAELLISKGPKTGNRVRITKREPYPAAVSRSHTNAYVSVTIGGRRQVLAVKLAAYWNDYVRIGSDGQERTGAEIELEVRSSADEGFRWSCWENALAHPREFAVFVTESGSTYACYVADGVFIHQIRGAKDSDASWREFWEHVREDMPDAIRPLTLGALFKPLGREPFEGKNALYYDIFVDDISEVAGELRVTVHGRNATPRYVFALREGKWELVSVESR